MLSLHSVPTVGQARFKAGRLHREGDSHAQLHVQHSAQKTNSSCLLFQETGQHGLNVIIWILMIKIQWIKIYHTSPPLAVEENIKMPSAPSCNTILERAGCFHTTVILSRVFSFFHFGALSKNLSSAAVGQRLALKSPRWIRHGPCSWGADNVEGGTCKQMIIMWAGVSSRIQEGICQDLRYKGGGIGKNLVKIEDVRAKEVSLLP